MSTYYTMQIATATGSETQSKVANSGTSGVPFISQGTSSAAAYGTAVVAGGGTGATSFNTTGVVISGSTGTTALAAVTLTDGQLAIGSSAGNPAAATITAGSGISVTNGHNSITIAATGSEMAWSEQSTNFNAVAGHGYFITGTATATMPSSGSIGDTISFATDVSNILTITANTGQVLRIGAAQSAVAGTAVNNTHGDSVTFVFRAGDSLWMATSVIGTWIVT